MALPRQHSIALTQLAEAALMGIPTVDADAYEVPWESMHNVAVGCARVGSSTLTTQALAATEPPALRGLATACAATQLARWGDAVSAKTMAGTAESLVSQLDHPGVKAHTLAELACVRARLGRADMAKQHLAAALPLAKSVTTTLSVTATMARALVELRQLSNVQSTLDAGPWNSRFPVVHNSAGELRTLSIALAESGAWKQAWALSDRCVEASGDDVDQFADIRLALARTGRIDDLLESLNAMDIDDDELARVHLLLATHGHVDKSKKLPTAKEREPYTSCDDDDPTEQVRATLHHRDFNQALEQLQRIADHDTREYACSEYLDICVDAFAPDAAVRLFASKPYNNPVAEVMDTWNTFHKLSVFAYG